MSVGTATFAPVHAVPVSTNGLVVTSASVQVQSVGTASTWVDASTVYEGSPARLVLAVSAPSSGSVRVTVTLPGADRTIADESVAVEAGASTLAVTLNLSYGAWITSGAGTVANPADHLDVTVSFASTPPAPAPTSAELPSPTPSPTPPSTPPATPTPAPTLSTTPVRTDTVAPIRVLLAGPSLADRRSVIRAIASLPPGARVIVVIRPSKGQRSEALRVARSVAAVARESGRSAIIRLGPSAPGARARLELVVAPTLVPRSGATTSSASFDVSLVLAPRPVVFVHGMWSDATWWSAYLGGSGFLAGADSTWVGAAVNTMDTGTALLPYASVKTVSENAALAWTFIQGRMSSLNAHKVDVVGHSLGGVIIRRMLHDPATGADARTAIRGVVLLGTPNGGSDCSTAWPVPANSELTFAAMDTFNLAYPGYPGTFTTSLYSDHIGSTCFRASSGDLFVPAWSTQAQSVDAVQRISPGVQHASMPSSSAVFSGYVRPALALAAAPVSSGPSTALTNPTAATTNLDNGTATGTSLTVTRSVTLNPGQTLVASVVAPGGSTGTLTFPSGAGTASVTLNRVGEFPVIQGEASYAALGGTTGPLTVSVTITASTTASSELRWDLVARS